MATVAKEKEKKLTAKEKRELILRRQQQQQRTLLAVIGVAALAVIGVIIFAVSQASNVEVVIDDSVKTAYAETVPVGYGKTAEGFYYLGAENAPVLLEEFSSFSCSFCAQYHKNVFKNIQDKIKAGHVKFVYVPLYTYGSFPSENMAKAALCAGEQGKFWEMHDVMFDWQSRYGQGGNDINRLTTAAGALGLDRGKFGTCMNSAEVTTVLQTAASVAQTRGISGTPSLFGNGAPLTTGPQGGALGLNELRGFIEAEVAKKQ